MKINLKKILLIIIIFLPLIITLISWGYLPDAIPINYGGNGQVTRWGNKYEALIIPIIGIVISLISFVVTNHVASDLKHKNNIKILKNFNLMVAITFNVLTISFLLSSFKQTMNVNNTFSSKLIYIVFGIWFIILGNYLPKCEKNSVVGIRTVMTLSSDEIWFKTHKFGGKVIVIFGVIFTVASLFIPTNIAMPILIISLLIIIIIVYIYIKRLVKKRI